MAPAMLVLSLTLLFCAGCNSAKSPAKTPGKTAAADPSKSPAVAAGGNQKSPTPATAQSAKQDVRNAIDGAIALLENEDYKPFIEEYLPVREYRRIRDEPGGIDIAVMMIKKRMKKEPGFLGEILAQLRAAKSVEPEFNAGNNVARFTVTIAPADPTKSGEVPLLLSGDPKPAPAGYGDDVAKAAEQAAADLAAGKLKEYLQRTLPVSELQLNNLDAIVARLKSSGTVPQAIHDWKLMTSMKPTMEENGTVAVYQLPTTGPAYSDKSLLRPKKPQTRTVKLQKSAGNWRLYDNVSALKTASAKFAGKVPAVTESFSMEKIGGNWRLYEKGDEDRRSERSWGGGKTVRRHRAEQKSDYGRPR